MDKILLQNCHFLMLLVALLFNNVCQAFSSDDDDQQWMLRKVYNVRWNVSKSYLAEHIIDAQLAGVADTKMSLFYGMDSDNMLIQFHSDSETGVGYCEIGVIQGKNNVESIVCPPGPPFCSIISPKVEWIVPAGIYNKPMKAPQCIYDFYVGAQDEAFEYELLRYCAKAYFFNGKNYDNPERIMKYRKDWLLLAKGQLTCGIAGVETGKQLLAHGYTVELVHKWNFVNSPDMPDTTASFKTTCPKLEATLSIYEDNDEEGSFFLAAMVGAGQLDGKFADGEQFWDQANFDRKINNDNFCYMEYHKWLRQNGDVMNGRYNLQLRVTHHCTGREMRETIAFDVSVGPAQAPEGIYEDIKITINLSEGKFGRDTGHTLEALISDQQ